MANRTLTSGRQTGASTFSDVADAVDDLRSFVTISRTHPSDVGERHVFVRLDDARYRLSFGDCLTAELAPGAHRLRAHNTLMWRTVPFTLEAGEHLEFVLINSGRWWTWGVAGLLGCAPLFLRVQMRSRL